MNYSSLPTFPPPLRFDTADHRPGGDPRLSARARRVLQDLIWLAAIGALLFLLRQITLAIERPDLEHDLGRVYETIPSRCDYGRLRWWCGLRVTLASKEEAERARAILLASRNPAEFVCGPPVESVRDQIRKSAGRWQPTRWERIHHPTDPARWIGIGVWEMYRTGADPEPWIVYRVPVGFSS
jgi:hypothetical protein